jgi:tricarballylate dehydrogenase
MSSAEPVDVVIVGAGNAALCAALAAREAGAETITVLERAPIEERGGNSYYTGGGFRFPYAGTDDVCSLLPHLRDQDADDIDLAAYPEEKFFADMGRVTHYRCDPEMVELLVTQARDGMRWLGEHGVRFGWSRGRHAFKVDGRFKFWGGLTIEVNGAGAGLVERLSTAVEQAGIRIEYGTRAVDLLMDGDAVVGVQVRTDAGLKDIPGRAVVLACGGFEANEEWRARYLGPNWDLARVRGTRFNTGDGHKMALDIGARPFGHWSGCHATAWDSNAPLVSDRKHGDSFSRHSYPLGIVVNTDCQRFIDEGADFQSYTYAKYGAELLKQPGIQAFQLFDDKVIQHCRSDYRASGVSRIVADTIEDLAKGLEVDPDKLVATVSEFNAAVQAGDYDPNVKDGKRTSGLRVDKTNWALPLDTPPYYGYPVTTGVTFTFGGVRIDAQGRVLDWSGDPISGLYAAGEIVGGLFYHNYPSGTGLMAGTVFGRIAGASAAKLASQESVGQPA